MLGWVTAALKIVPVIVGAVKAVESLLSATKGKAKQDAAVDLVTELVPIVEASIGRDVVDDAAVQDAIRKVIDAVVSLMNVVRDVSAKRAAA